MFKVNNRNTRTRREICSKLTIKTPSDQEGSNSDNGLNQCEFEELTFESETELINGCYNNESIYSMGEITKIKEKNINLPEKRDGTDDTTRLINRTWCTCKN